MVKIIIYTTLILFLAGNVYAENDVKQEIIKRCKSQMGEYGASMVKACVDQDIEAVIAISKYPDQYDSIVARCMGQMQSYGFSMVKACADQDIEAENALSNY